MADLSSLARVLIAWINTSFPATLLCVFVVLIITLRSPAVHLAMLEFREALIEYDDQPIISADELKELQEREERKLDARTGGPGQGLWSHLLALLRGCSISGLAFYASIALLMIILPAPPALMAHLTDSFSDRFRLACHEHTCPVALGIVFFSRTRLFGRVEEFFLRSNRKLHVVSRMPASPILRQVRLVVITTFAKPQVDPFAKKSMAALLRASAVALLRQTFVATLTGATGILRKVWSLVGTIIQAYFLVWQVVDRLVPGLKAHVKWPPGYVVDFNGRSPRIVRLETEVKHEPNSKVERQETRALTGAPHEHGHDTKRSRQANVLPTYFLALRTIQIITLTTLGLAMFLGPTAPTSTSLAKWSTRKGSSRLPQDTGSIGILDLFRPEIKYLPAVYFVAHAALLYALVLWIVTVLVISVHVAPKKGTEEVPDSRRLSARHADGSSGRRIEDSDDADDKALGMTLLRGGHSGNSEAGGPPISSRRTSRGGMKAVYELWTTKDTIWYSPVDRGGQDGVPVAEHNRREAFGA
ncbi:hypothetical protein V8E36_005275 [Tilletia maclaganii]